MQDLKNKLNPAQFASVTTINGPILVIAGAGSGKTRTIEYRVSHLVQNNIQPGSILLLTFTRKAAHEMLSRAAIHDERCRHVDGGTFHSFAFRMLRKYSKALGLSNQFSILDESDAEEAIYRCGSRLNMFEKDRKFPKKNTVRSIFSMSLNKGLPISEILEKEYPHFLACVDEIEGLRKKYTAYKVNKNHLDYDDLLVYLKMLLEAKDIRAQMSGKYRYIMVDEYQDTNMIQGDIAYLLAEEHRNIMAVGDDAQSIYGFRGTSHKNIMEFPRKFKECRIVKLEDNYRSTQSILNVANAVLENMNNKYSKCLVSARKEAGERPKLNFFKNSYDEAYWIVSKIKELKADGVELHHQAVLFRSAYVSIALQAELSKNGIPYQIFGGLKFYETAHVKDLISHMKVIMNPRDEISWHRILTLVEGVGTKTADRIIDQITKKASIAEIAKNIYSEDAKGRKLHDGLKRVKSFLKSASAFKLGPGALYDIAYDHYLPLLKQKFDDWHIRVNDLEALRQVSARYGSLSEFLADFAIEPPERGVWNVGPRLKFEEKPLTLSTIHSSKGLEWDTVYLISLVEGVLPSSFSLNDEEEIEEESRLFYVAVTRAKNRLFMSLGHEGMRGGITQFNKISRFLDAPNVMSGLDQSVNLESESEIGLDEGDIIRPAYDKRAILKYIDNLYD